MMWIVIMNDAKVDEDVEVIASDFDELQRIMAYIHNSLGRFELEKVEQRWMYFGLDGLRDAVDNDVPDKI